MAPLFPPGKSPAARDAPGGDESAYYAPRESRGEPQSEANVAGGNPSPAGPSRSGGSPHAQ